MCSRLPDILLSTDRKVTFRRKKTRRKYLASIYVMWELKNINKGASSPTTVFLTGYVLQLWHKALKRPRVE